LRWLELKIPPPAVAALIAGAMWGIAAVTPSIDVPALVRSVTAALLVLVGVAFAIAGIISFRLARTTVNPLKPEKTSSLVCSGIYRLTRNPMYVGMLFVLIAWAEFLSSPWALLGPLAFVYYMNRFQIVPEERVLSTLFGTDYATYKLRVRRWL
jgi:protein-S-isoprenylcysteine O-methyltransferase Ste14